MLSALDLARRIEAGDLTPRARGRSAARRPSPRAKARSARSPRSTSRRRGAPPNAASSRARRCADLPVGIKDIFDTADLADRLWLADLCRPPAEGRCRDGDAGAARRRHRPRQDRHDRVRLAAAGRRPAIRATPRTRPAARPRARPPRSRPACCRSRSAARPAARSSVRPRICGVAGFKPSYRLLPTVGMKCFSWSLDTVGLFAAGVADVAFAAAAISGRDLRVDGRPPPAPAIAIVRTAAWDEASAPMQSAVERAARAAEKAGAKIEELALPPIFEEAARAHRDHPGYEAFRALAFEYDNHRDRLGPLLRGSSTKPRRFDADAYDDARRIARRARQAFAELLAGRRRDPHAVGAGRGAARAHVYRRADLQPAVDAAWARPASTSRDLPMRRGCRSACRSSHVSGAIGSRLPPRRSSSSPSRGWALIEARQSRT